MPTFKDSPEVDLNVLAVCFGACSDELKNLYDYAWAGTWEIMWEIVINGINVSERHSEFFINWVFNNIAENTKNISEKIMKRFFKEILNTDKDEFTYNEMGDLLKDKLPREYAYLSSIEVVLISNLDSDKKFLDLLSYNILHIPGVKELLIEELAWNKIVDYLGAFEYNKDAYDPYYWMYWDDGYDYDGYDEDDDDYDDDWD